MGHSISLISKIYRKKTLTLRGKENNSNAQHSTTQHKLFVCVLHTMYYWITYAIDTFLFRQHNNKTCKWNQHHHHCSTTMMIIVTATTTKTKNKINANKTDAKCVSNYKREQQQQQQSLEHRQ